MRRPSEVTTQALAGVATPRIGVPGVADFPGSSSRADYPRRVGDRARFPAQDEKRLLPISGACARLAQTDSQAQPTDRGDARICEKSS